MGNRTSKVDTKDPYKILGVSIRSTQEEIRAAYTRLVRKYHPDSHQTPDPEKLQMVIDAYKEIQTVQLTTPKQPVCHLVNFDDNFFKNCDDLIEKVCGIFDAIEKLEPYDGPKFPKFDSKFRQFYLFFGNFKTRRIFDDDLETNKIRQREYNEAILNIVAIICKYDKRFSAKIEKEPTQDYKIKKKTKKTVKMNFNDYDFFCELCRKGFKSKNQLETHFNSNKHKIKIANLNSSEMERFKTHDNVIIEETIFLEKLNEEENKEEVVEIEKRISEKEETLPLDFDNKATNYGKKSLQNDKNKVGVNPKNKLLDKKTKKKHWENSNSEPVHFLKCHACKDTFCSRLELIKHVKECDENQKT